MSHRIAVKICGIKDATALEAAAEGGADYVGFVFAASRRKVTPDEAAALIRRLPERGPQAVGVFVDEQPGTVKAIADFAGLDMVQLCGNETVSMAIGCGRPVIRSFQPRIRVSWQRYAAFVESGFRLMIDAYQPGLFGGTGTTGNWELAAKVARRYPILLAGGLTPETVGSAIAQVRPWGVDVSSGVETAGVKDPEKICAFLQAARAATVPARKEP